MWVKLMNNSVRASAVEISTDIGRDRIASDDNCGIRSGYPDDIHADGYFDPIMLRRRAGTSNLKLHHDSGDLFGHNPIQLHEDLYIHKPNNHFQ